MTEELRTEWTSVTTEFGDLRALLHMSSVLSDDEPRPGVVLVDGSGDGVCDDWGGWPERVASCDAVVLTYDKPGCGGSPGHWTQQSMADRAVEALAAVEVLRADPRCQGQPVGLLGVSQGGWASLLASAIGGTDFVVSVSGPGVSPAAQERDRISRELAGLPSQEHADAMAWVDERCARLVAGEPVDAVLADQQRFTGCSWYSAVSVAYDTQDDLAFVAGMLDFDPVPVLRSVTSPVLALFGGSDPLIPVTESVAAYAENLAALDGVSHGLAVFPRANHGLFVPDTAPGGNAGQLAAGVLPMIASCLTDARVRQPSS